MSSCLVLFVCLFVWFGFVYFLLFGLVLGESGLHRNPLMNLSQLLLSSELKVFPLQPINQF